MELDDKIRQALGEHAAKYGPPATMLAKVKSVDEDEKTCIVIETIGEAEIEIPEVRLRPVTNGNESITIYPKADTYVLCIRIENDEQWMVVAVDEAERVNVKTDNTEFDIKEGVLIQRGNDTLKQIIQLTIEATQQIVVLIGNNPDYAKLVQALTKLNNVLR